MSTPLIRNGKLVAGAFKGHDLTRLTSSQADGMNTALDKERRGERLTAKDLDALVKAHAASAQNDPLRELTDKLREFNRGARL